MTEKLPAAVFLLTVASAPHTAPVGARVPNVVFVEGLVREGPRCLFYYGGADTDLGVAEAFIR